MEINRQRETMTLMKNYLCLFWSQVPLANGDLKKTCSSVRNNWPPLCTWAFLKHTYLSPQRKPEMSRSICSTQPSNSFITDHENLQEILPELMGFSGHQVHMPDCTYLWFCFWLQIPGISRHHNSPSLEALDVSYEVLNIICFSGDLNSTIALGRDT